MAPIMFLFVALFSLALMLLWNWLLPEIFGLKAISYLQALGLLLLSKLIFSGVGRGHHSPSRYGHHWHRPSDLKEDESEAEGKV